MGLSRLSVSIVTGVEKGLIKIELSGAPGFNSLLVRGPRDLQLELASRALQDDPPRLDIGQ